MDSRNAEFARLASVLVSGHAEGDKRVFSALGQGDPTLAVPAEEYVFSALGQGDTSLNRVHQVPVIAPSAGLAIHRNAAVKAARKLGRVARSVRQQDFLFQQSKQVEAANIAKAYNNAGFPPITSGTPLNPNAISMPSSVDEQEVHANESIRSLALRLMGNAAFWKQIAILNGLKPPYIAVVASDGVLAPGDKILIPKLGDADDVTNSSGDQLNSDPNSDALSPVVRKYGRDLLLSDSSTGTDVADIRVNQRGDLDVTEGIPNIYQALMIKFSTEEGDLSLHPEFGALYPVGTKVKFSSVQDFAINTRATLLSDARVEDVVDLQLDVAGDIIRVNAKVKLKQTNNTLAVNFAVRGV